MNRLKLKEKLPKSLDLSQRLPSQKLRLNDRRVAENMLSCARQRGITHPPCSYLSLPFSITSSIRTFYSSPPSEHKTTRQKIAKEKATERYHKIVRKREIKGLQEERNKVKQERAYQEQQRRIVEVKEKQVVAQVSTLQLSAARNGD